MCLLNFTRQAAHCVAKEIKTVFEQNQREGENQDRSCLRAGAVNV